MAKALTNHVVISEARFRGPGSTRNDFIEIFNPSASSIDISGWQLQSCAAGGGSSTFPRATVPADTALAAGQHFLFTNNTYSGAVPGDITFTYDFPDTSGAAISDFSGNIIDSIGSTPCTEGTAVSFPASNSDASLARVSNGCQDTNDNASDFALITPSEPQNLASTKTSCLPSTAPTASGSATPTTVDVGADVLLTVTVTPGGNPDSTGIVVKGDLTEIGGAAEQVFADNGDGTFSFTATVVSGTSTGTKSLPIAVTDAQSRTASTIITLNVQIPRIYIHAIQGAAHISPLNGQLVSNVQGIVTATRSNGFYLQERDADVDADIATSEGIFVFTGAAPIVSVGDAVVVAGTVKEFRPSGVDGLTNLSVTEIDNPGRSITVVSSGNALPAATVIGTGGRVPPAAVIDDDANGNVETSGTFDPATDGIDFYESLEGMRVQVNNAVAVGPTNSFNETPVLGDNGANASVRTARGGVVVQAGDFNPERIILDDGISGGPSMPKVSVGATFPGATLGVMDYSFGNYKLNVTSLPGANTTTAATRETTTLTVGANQLTVATFNVENLTVGNAQSKFNALAAIVVNNLGAPDIIAIEEIQDNNGTTDNGTVDASATYAKLIAAIQATNGGTGPTYQFRQIDPGNDQDGGAPGGNIRVGFLFRTDRGVSFVDRAAPGSCASLSTCPVSVVGGSSGPQLSFSPGRIDPTNAAFNDSRKPLAGEFMFNGRKVFVIANHFNSKTGDEPLMGRNQPPARSSEIQRKQQATIVRAFVDDLLAADADANIVVLGDLNDFQFSDTLGILKGSGATELRVLLETLPLEERYSYVFDGNSQALDQILISPHLYADAAFAYDVVHVNAEFSPQDSDHDPQLVRFTLPPVAPAAGNLSLTVQEDTPQAITLQGTAGRGGTLTYTIVGNPAHGTLGTINGNQIVYTPAADYSGPDAFTYKVTESGLDSNIATVSLTVSAVNDAPVATGDTVTTQHNTPVTITLGATDTEGDSLTFSVVTGPAHGTLGTIVGNQVTYTPASGYGGADAFTFQVNDGANDSNIATISITVGSAPTAANIQETTQEDAARTITLQGTAGAGGTLTYSIVNGPSHGTLSIISGAQVTYTPAANYFDGDSFTYRVTEGGVESNIATVSITIGAVNDAPVAANDSATTRHNTPVTITLGATDVDSGSLTFSIVTGPSHGTLGMIAGNQVTYTPASGYSGPDAFTFQASDGTSASNVATISITVGAPPTATSFAVTTQEDTAKVITLQGTAGEGGALAYSIANGPSHGTLGTINGAQVTYTPAANYAGPDSFTYRVTEGGIESNTATVTITVSAVNDPPVATGGAKTTQYNTPVAITLGATDIDSDTLTYSIVLGPTHGTLGTISGNSVTYTPASGYSGADSFTFQASDGQSASNIATITITVGSAPSATNLTRTTPEDTALTITLQGTASEGGAMTYSIAGNPTHGTLSTVNGAQVTYTPGGNYAGTDSFTYRVTENGVESAPATVSLTVTPVNDLPVAGDIGTATNRDTSKTITLVATDVDGDSLTYAIVAVPTHGTLGLINGNQVTYTPSAGYAGADSFTFKARDAVGDSNIATVSISVAGGNRAPIASAGSASTAANTSVAITLVATDADGNALTYSIVGLPAHGTLGAVSGNQVTYTPAAGYVGTDSFTFKASDGVATSNTATVTIAIATPTVRLTVTATGGGTATPPTGDYAVGGTVTLTATANAGSSFIGWTIDGGFAGLQNPLTLTMGTGHTVVATFAPTPAFGDVGPSATYGEAIRTLAAYGAILGYTPDACQRASLGNSCFGPENQVTRAEMAALIVRAMGWRGERHDNPFTDKGGLNDDLWDSVGTLAYYGVAFGYGDGRFGPNDKVTYIQAISFITRAMVKKGYWVQAQSDDGAIYPNVPANSPHRLDLVTFVQHAGQLPAFASDASLDSWNLPATRGWYAAALYGAIRSRFALTP